jgi:hypothetical protein
VLSDEAVLARFGPRVPLEKVLAAVTERHCRRFVLIACVVFGFPTTDLLHRKATEFLEPPLALTHAQWPLG